MILSTVNRLRHLARHHGFEVILMLILAMAVSLAKGEDPPAQSEQAKKQNIATTKTNESNTHPRFVMLVSKSFFQKVIDGKFSSDFNVNDTIRGARVHGKGKLQATVKTSLLPTADKGTIRIEITGNTTSNTTSTQDRVSVRNQSNLTFNSTSSLLVTPAGLSIQPFQTRGKLESKITGISTPFPRVRRNIARRKVYSRKEQDRFAAEKQAIEDLNDTFEKKIVALLEPFNDNYEKSVRKPLMRKDKFPKDLSITTTPSHLKLQGLFVETDQLSEPSKSKTESKTLPLEMDVAFTVHQSALNDILGSTIAGRTFPLEEALGQALLAEQNPVNKNKESVLIQFDDTSPLHVSFDGNGLEILLSGASYSYKGQRYSRMDLRLNYQVERRDGRLWLVQSQKPSVLLSKSADGKRPKLGIRDYTLRRILKNVLKESLPQAIDLSSVTLPSSFAALSPLSVKHLEIEDGWLSAGVNFKEKLENKTTASETASDE